jgi:hypothetical protein
VRWTRRNAATVTEETNQEVVVLPSQQPFVECTNISKVACLAYDCLQIRVEPADECVVELVTIDIGDSNPGRLSFAEYPVDWPGAQQVSVRIILLRV